MEGPPVIQAADALGSPDGRFAVLQNTHISPMAWFRTYFPLVTGTVTRLAERDISVSSLFRTVRNQDNERLRQRPWTPAIAAGADLNPEAGPGQRGAKT